ncbi:MAG: prepilin-type N-terminal cleavage/methylation domain-containing protein [Sulfuricurvum sp.]
MSFRRRAMSLIELLVVLVVMGIASSIALFALKKSGSTVSTVSLQSLKKTVLPLTEGEDAVLVCAADCKTCTLRFSDPKKTLPLTLKNTEGSIRYGFDLQGELHPLGRQIVSTQEGYEESCFSWTISAEGIVSPLILKKEQTFYAFSPLGGDRPVVSTNEETIRKFFYNETYYPMKRGDYYERE